MVTTPADWPATRLQFPPFDLTDLAKDFQQELFARYSEPKRAYHTLRHITEGFMEYGDLIRLNLIEDPQAFGYAWWCHDAVYVIDSDPAYAPQNELWSADFAEEWLKRFGAAPEFIARVRGHILATKHNQFPEDLDAQLLVDVDLSILGKSRMRFDEYERQIRQEYSYVLREQYIEGRTRVLKGFLPPHREHIYFTEYFRAKYEAQARENLAYSLAKLACGELAEV